MRITGRSVAELRAAYLARSLSPIEVLDAFAARIEEAEPVLNAFVTLALGRARAEAVAAERAYARGNVEQPLLGIPFAAKDVFDTEGVRTTYGSRMFAEHTPTRDAEAVQRLRAAGGILVGKTATHEFAWGLTTTNPHFGATRNPWATDRIPGGSSGGSAAAIAADEVPLALGTDTGGSVRIPASFCGVVGLKPTFGRVSTAGVFPLARSLDHVGGLARTPADAALMLAAIAGPDACDPATVGVPDIVTGDDGPGFSVATCGSLRPVGLARDVQAVFDRSLRALASLGADVVDVELPEAERCFDTFLPIQLAEALFAHRRAGLWPSRRSEYGPDIRERLELAERVRLDEYLAALIERGRIRAAFLRVLERVDVIVSAVSPVSPPRIGEKGHQDDETLRLRELVLPFTVPQNLTGLPTCVVPAGFDALGIPIGVQLTGAPWCETTVLRAAQALFDVIPAIRDDPELRRRVAPGAAGLPL